MKIDYSLLKKLAKSNYYQTVYKCANEYNFKIFENDSNFSAIQLLFFNYLSFYSAIFIDIYLKEVDKIVLDNEIYEEAYIAYKNKKDTKELEQRQANKPSRNINSSRKTATNSKESQVKSQWKFRR